MNVPGIIRQIKLLFVLIFIINGNIFSQTVNNKFDFSSAVIVVPKNITEREKVSIEMLTEEVKVRTNINLHVTADMPDKDIPVIIMGTFSSLRLSSFLEGLDFDPESGLAEGFSVKIANDGNVNPKLYIVGNDNHGLLYGAGYFLRKAYLSTGKILVSDNIDIDTHPSVKLRGHQLGYRPKTNSYCGFDLDMWEQYIRDLIVFGTNAIEIIPPNTDDVETSPMFTLQPLEMMFEMSNLVDKYDIDLWIWSPLMYGDYTKSENFEKSLEENKSFFSSLKRIDAVFVPGGDPGHTPPAILFDYLEKKTELLHQFHPEAEMWVSPQGFDAEWMNEFFRLLEEEPWWLTGVVHGPQVSMEVNQFRDAVPRKFLVRLYPDITHAYDAQYVVPDWDFAFAATQNREPINPRPVDQARIFHSARMENFHGYITYSEGVNDDVNKIIWNGLGWNMKTDIIDILRDYSRYFIGVEYENDFLQAILGLEQNWRGALISNSQVDINHNIFKSMEKRASPSVRLNWRFQMALYRSYYDAYVKNRLLYEINLEQDAMEILREAKETGSVKAMQKAEDKLDQASFNKVSQDTKQRLDELAEALFNSIRMQLSVEKYFATAIRRGANLDLAEYPLNNRVWLIAQFNRIRQIEGENERLEEIGKIINWTNPGPGGFYTDLGDIGNQPQLVSEDLYSIDPQFLTHSFAGFTIGGNGINWRVSWARYMQTLYDQPLRMHYTNLDPEARYTVKVTYVNDLYSGRKKVRLEADGIEVHPLIDKPVEIRPLSFDVPVEASKDGELTLKWISESGQGGTGRGCQIGEVWLIKND